MPDDLEMHAREYLGKDSLPGDLINAAGALSMRLFDPEDWPHIRPVLTYGQYVCGVKLSGDPQLAAKIMELADKRVVSVFDNLVEDINKLIAAGISSQERASAAHDLLKDLIEFIHG